VWGAARHNEVYAARYHLTGRADNPLRDGQARADIAGALLRQLFIVVTRRVAGTRPSPGGRKYEGVVDKAA
jgi:hypothetical protein